MTSAHEEEMGRLCVRHREVRNAYKIVVGNPEWERPVWVITTFVREDNIKN
jgi:hypothetical protein